MNRSLGTASLCLLSMTIAPAVMAQAVKSSVEAAATTGAPEFRDPKSGLVWTPENVGQDGKPIGPDDKAFDPRGQNAPRQAALQKAIAKPVGSVPVTAGPTVPIVNLEIASLRAVPGQRWQAVMYIANNSGNPIEPIIECHFTNHGQPVSDTRAAVSQLGAGVRAGLVVVGPRIEIFVDRTMCQVISP
jgi:hypothetical protein